MPPKVTTPKAKANTSSSHASYQDMITEAIINLKERNGSSRVALKKYVRANNSITVSDNMFDSLFNKALKGGVDKGVFAQPKGSSGGTKLAKKEPKPAAKPAAAKPAAKSTDKKPTAKKATATKKTTTTKATKAKAPVKTNTAAAKPKTVKKPAAPKAKKAAAPKAAPAVVDKPAVLGKTKSGRVTKTTSKTAPAKKATPKKAATKKATPKKAAATTA